MDKKEKITFWKILKIIVKFTAKAVWSVIKFPFRVTKREIQKKTEPIVKYSELNVLKTNKGEFNKWQDKIMNSESTIGIILGARGSGKTAFGLRWAENLYSKNKKKVLALGFNQNQMPSWIKVIENINEIQENSFLLVDEGGILFNSRNTMNKPNKILSELLFISRHKNLSVLFISQNSANIEINALRQADYLILKPSSLLQQEFERKIIQKIYSNTQKEFEELKNQTGASYIYSSEFQGFVANDLPSFWNTKVSKSFKEKKIE